MKDQHTYAPELKGLKVAFIGNQDCNAYRVCKWGRKLGVEGHLFHCPEKYSKLRSLPELIDPEIKGNYPSWITVLDSHRHDDVFGLRPDLVEHINNTFNAIVTSGEWGVREVQHFDKLPLFHLSIGGDIGVIPWQDWRSFENRIDQYRQRIYQASLHRYKAIFTSNRKTMAKLSKINLGDRPFPWAPPEDVASNKHRANKVVKANLDSKYKDTKRVFMWLSRLLMDSTHFGNKKTDIFIKAFSSFVKQNPDYPIRTVMVSHGPSKDKVYDLCQRLEVGHLIDWVPHLPYTELLAYLSFPKAVIFDDFSHTNDQLSGIGRDALSVGGVIVKSIDRKWTEYLYGPDCPVLHADTVDECLQHMYALNNDDYFSQKQKESKLWANTYLDYPLNTKKFFKRIQQEL